MKNKRTKRDLVELFVLSLEQEFLSKGGRMFSQEKFDRLVHLLLEIVECEE